MTGGEWTPDLLKQYLDARLSDLDRRLSDTTREINARAEDHNRMQQQAVEKAETSMAARFGAVNEFREQLADQARTFMPRAEAEAAWRRTAERLEAAEREHRTFVTRTEHQAMADRVGANDARLTEQEGRHAGAEGRITSARQAIFVAVAVVGLAVTLVVTLLDFVLVH